MGLKPALIGGMNLTSGRQHETALAVAPKSGSNCELGGLYRTCGRNGDKGGVSVFSVGLVLDINRSRRRTLFPLSTPAGFPPGGCGNAWRRSVQAYELHGDNQRSRSSFVKLMRGRARCFGQAAITSPRLSSLCQLRLVYLINMALLTTFA